MVVVEKPRSIHRIVPEPHFFDIHYPRVRFKSRKSNMEVKKKARAEPKGESFPSYENPNTLPIANVKIREITRYTRLIFAEVY
jgi:hypothetical protein